MKLKLHSANFEECTITFQVPSAVYSKLGFAPEELEVDLIPLMDFYTLRKIKEATDDQQSD